MYINMETAILPCLENVLIANQTAINTNCPASTFFNLFKTIAKQLPNGKLNHSKTLQIKIAAIDKMVKFN